ncbi:response regulator [Flavobacterium amniphilum]|uniref:tetratricopeptide repeat-containing hybrid sensor histidine kinase/response regulator n=1 Tax=Flavobacterium amniphilum TaxID=1834035 RepID=UPI002029C984|nr:response regulator [Flavobacterium amniphilum]MCL9805349.1 response regulator [Flavobacterium amniphilum]
MKFTTKANAGFDLSMIARVLSCCFVVLVFFTDTSAFAFQKPISIDPKVLKEFEDAKKILEINDYDHYKEGSKMVNQLEKKLIDAENYDQLLYLYLEISYYHVTKFDYTSSKKVLDRAGKVLDKHNNNVIRGEYYEHLAVFYNSQGNEGLDEKYTLLSEKYLKQYAPREKQVDMYYNLTLLYLKKEDWPKTLDNSLKFLSLNKELGGDPDQPEVSLLTAESYYNLNQLDKAREYLQMAQKSVIFQKYDEDFLLKSRYYSVLGRLYEKEHKYTEAADNLKIANDYFKKRLVYRVVKMNHFLNQKRELEVKNIEFQSIIKENKLRSENEKYKNYLLLLCLFAIIILIVLLYFQYRNAKFKSSTNDLLNEKNALLHKANSELETALNVKRKLLDTISHELRTPIYTLNGLLHLMEGDKSNYDQNIEQLQASVQNLYSLSGNIIEINVIDSLEKDYIPKKDVVSLDELMTKILAIVRKNRDNNITESLLIDSAIPSKLVFDEAKLYQVLYSLIDNAFKFSKNGKVSIEAKKTNEIQDKIEVQFIIKDTGIGIDAEIKEKIYDLFFQGSDKINYEYGGSGLGLTLVKKTLGLFGKTIIIDSQPEIGTTISFSLDFEVFNGTAETEEISKEIKDPSTVRILLVEDNKTNQLITKTIIVKKGYVCEVANDGLEACKMVEAKDYDLVLMDIMMPIMDGFEASDHISKLKPYIPIVALTAISEEVNRELFSSSRIRKVLSKPVDVEELYETITVMVNE